MVAEEADKGLFGISLSHTHSAGQYGMADTTRIDLSSVIVDYARGPWFASLSIPAVRISGFGTVRIGATIPIQVRMPDRTERMGQNRQGKTMPQENRPQGGMRGSQRSRSVETGLGDLNAEVGYGFFPLDMDGVLLELGGSAKFPTADAERGLGTGRADYSVRGNASLPHGRFQPFVEGRYTITGDSESLALNDVFSGSIGTDLLLGPKFTLTGAYSFQQKAIDSAEDFHEVSLSAEWPLMGIWRSWVFFARGLSDAAPEWTGGIGLGASF